LNRRGDPPLRDGRRINETIGVAADGNNDEGEQERESAHLGLQGERDRTKSASKMRRANVHLQHMPGLK
jgi:hypothetical protein